MIEEPQQLLIGIPEYIGLFLIGLWAGKKDIFKRIPGVIKKIKFLQWSSLCISCLLSCPIIYYFYKKWMSITLRIYKYGFYLEGKR